jgi:hypothetical protein
VSDAKPRAPGPRDSSVDPSGGERRRRGSTERGKSHASRAEIESPFSIILRALVEAVPLAAGAALVDGEGETVDYAGNIDTFDLKVAAAHFQVVLSDVRAYPPLSTVREIRVVAKKRAYLLRTLDADYSLLLLLHRHGGFSVSRRALREAVGRLCVEAGLAWSDPEPLWYRVEVETSSMGRPTRLRAPPPYAELSPPPSVRPPSPFQNAHATRDPFSWNELEVIGALMGTGPKERGYRIRLASGAEMTLVRERNRLWFVDELL